MDKLIPSFERSMFSTIFNDIGSDYLEISIDSILENDLLKELPICKTVIGVGRTIQNIRERNFLRNTAIFIAELNSKKFDLRELEDYKLKLENKKFEEKELGRIIILLDRYVDQFKCKLLAKLYRKYVEQEYNWEKFCELSDILNRLFEEDIHYLREIDMDSERTLTYHIYKIPYSIRRLESIGLVEVLGEYSKFGDRLLQTENMFVQLTDNGKIFVDVTR